MGRVTHPREKNCFDGQWYFHKGDIPVPYAVKAGMTGGLTDCRQFEQGQWLEVAYADGLRDERMDPAEWRLLSLPHDWALEEDYSRSASKERGYLPVGIGCYRKLFRIPASDLGKKIAIEFDGVMRHSTVWVNGHLLGTHASGTIGFRYDLTDVLRYGDEGENVIFVRVDASDYEGWWYDGCGIYRHVWLEKTDRLHVGRWGSYVTTPEISREQASVRLELAVMNEHSRALECEIASVIVDGEGREVASALSVVSLAQDSRLAVFQNFSVEHPRLWSPDSPELYTMLTSLRCEGRVLDYYETPFGIRQLEFTEDHGFLLNGEPLVIKGVCAHQDFAGAGVALPDRLHTYKLELIKEMGANAYRSAHHPAAPELLDACDRLGILVVEENRKLDSSPEGLRNLTSMLYRDRNHPSIIIWSMENEEPLEGTTMGTRILDTLARTARRIDPTRPTMAAMNHGFRDNGYADAVDLAGYNYGATDKNRDLQDRALFPLRKMIGSESASYTATRGVYRDDPEWGYCSEYGTSLGTWCDRPEKVWQDLMENPFLTGVFIWTAFDYRGEPTPYQWPNVSSHFGIMDTCGFPKHAYYYYRAMWKKDPLVHVLPHWNWRGREGEPIDVWVYSNCDAVELVLNGCSLGARERTPYGRLEWKVPYVPGELVATGSIGGEPAAEHRVVTAMEAYRIQLVPDRTELRADGHDVSIIRVIITDERGQAVPTADNLISFTVAGSGALYGVGNGDPSSHESDKLPYRRAFNGKCLAIVQAACEAGEIRVKAESPGLLSGEICLSAK